MAASYDPDSDPWTVLRRNFCFAAEKIFLCEDLLRPLLENRIITKGDYEELLHESMTSSKRKDRLLLDILPTRPPEMFPKFCAILRGVGQEMLADRLEGRSRPSGQQDLLLHSTATPSDSHSLPIVPTLDSEQTAQLIQERDQLQARLDEMERQNRALRMPGAEERGASREITQEFSSGMRSSRLDSGGSRAPRDAGGLLPRHVVSDLRQDSRQPYHPATQAQALLSDHQLLSTPGAVPATQSVQYQRVPSSDSLSLQSSQPYNPSATHQSQSTSSCDDSSGFVHNLHLRSDYYVDRTDAGGEHSNGCVGSSSDVDHLHLRSEYYKKGSGHGDSTTECEWNGGPDGLVCEQLFSLSSVPDTMSSVNPPASPSIHGHQQNAQDQGGRQ